VQAGTASHGYLHGAVGEAVHFFQRESAAVESPDNGAAAGCTEVQRHVVARHGHEWPSVTSNE